MIISHRIFKQLVFSLLSLYAGLLLYTNYLQEVDFYKNKLQLNDFKVSVALYEFLQHNSFTNHKDVGPGLSNDQQNAERQQTQPGPNLIVNNSEANQKTGQIPKKLQIRHHRTKKETNKRKSF